MFVVSLGGTGRRECRSHAGQAVAGLLEIGGGEFQ